MLLFHRNVFSLSLLLYVSLISLPSLHSLISCPTMGTSAYVIISLTPQMDVSDLTNLLFFYMQLVPSSTVHYRFFFGTKAQAEKETDNLQTWVQDWIDSGDVNGYYNDSLVSSSDTVQSDSNPSLSPLVEYIHTKIVAENKSPETCVLKKQITIISDYVNVNVSKLLSSQNNTENTQTFGLFHGLDVDIFDSYATFPVFSNSDLKELPDIIKQFTEDKPFTFPITVAPVSLPAVNNLFILDTSSHSNLSSQLFSNIVNGEMCSVSPNRLNEQYTVVVYAGAGNEVHLPWVGDQTYSFGNKCLRIVEQSMKNETTDVDNREVVARFLLSLAEDVQISFNSLVIGMETQYLALIPVETLKRNSSFSIYASLDPLTLYSNFTYTLLDQNAISSSLDHMVIPLSVAQQYNTNYSTVCHEFVAPALLYPSKPYHKPKHFYLALDDMVWMSACAALSAICVGYLIYQKSKRLYLKQIDILNEIAMQPLQYKAAKESAKMARLPWEIKSDRVHIDKEFLLGEGTMSNVYLGRLKGKAPIMQWIDRAEMKQFQDCAVAVRVPRHFDEPEEDQLFREIASMRRLRCHSHIALFLGWTSHDDLVCSLHELTHLNLLKYLGQLRETVSESSSSRVPLKQLYQIQWQICDGMSYIHSRNLIHRDVAARNILLTTGLRAKISGFGFCSDPGDPKFGHKGSALKYLPVKWLAPETHKGKFTQKSDVWSFGVLLYEIFSLGGTPYEDISSEQMNNTMGKTRILQRPKHASKSCYSTMQHCFHEFPDRRPSFNELREESFEIYEKLHDNPAFTTDED